MSDDFTVVGKIEIDTSAIEKVDQRAIDALREMAFHLQREIRDEMVIPRKEGFLQGEKFIVDDSMAGEGQVSLCFEGPYARRLYFHPEYNFHRDVWTDGERTYGGNVNAQGEWLAPWQAGGKYEDRPQKIFEAIMRREGLL